jgi:hypothetical protein
MCLVARRLSGTPRGCGGRLSSRKRKLKFFDGAVPIAEAGFEFACAKRNRPADCLYSIAVFDSDLQPIELLNLWQRRRETANFSTK